MCLQGLKLILSTHHSQEDRAVQVYKCVPFFQNLKGSWDPPNGKEACQ